MSFDITRKLCKKPGVFVHTVIDKKEVKTCFHVKGFETQRNGIVSGLRVSNELPSFQEQSTRSSAGWQYKVHRQNAQSTFLRDDERLLSRCRSQIGSLGQILLCSHIDGKLAMLKKCSLRSLVSGIVMQSPRPLQSLMHCPSWHSSP